MAPKNKSQPKAAPVKEAVKEYPTIQAKHEAEYLESRPYEQLLEKKGYANFTEAEKTKYTYFHWIDTGVWKHWPRDEQKELWAAVQKEKIPIPLPPPRDLGKDSKGREIGSYTIPEYEEYERQCVELEILKLQSARWTQLNIEGQTRFPDIDTEEDIEVERKRRARIAQLSGKKMGKYEIDPVWADVIPIPQEDGEGALAQIAYTDEYAEAMGYLRAVMASEEHSSRVLDLTEHIISMNAAHYTVWLYRASTIFALSLSVKNELKWLNDVALENQKNYQIWHHRQLLIDHLYDSMSSSKSDLEKLGQSELEFMTLMFAEDSKNYHVWSYRQYLVKKLGLFASSPEMESVENLLQEDVRNNSAWSHRFFLVFSNPAYCTPSSKATEPDPAIPADIIDRELNFAQAATFEAPQNQSPWNYLRGVLRKADRKLSTVESFALQFVALPDQGEEDVKSSHALDLLADIWQEKGEKDKADRALRLLGDTYDRIRKNYWEWRRKALQANA
ncbi:farnesyltransferase alpha subunit ram2 [Phlyctema vagabunda]|uniref:Protein farnesyltransferase/geranylgeranyltransferase type-1 subunit alpha n=1 Tax=Phlyctema vagabunda TaxID=108571 RepID=A0ABR4PZB7_9HELO